MQNALPKMLLGLLLAVLPFATLAQSTPQQAAEAVVQAMRSEGLPGLAAQMHPAELARFKSLLEPVVAPPANATPHQQRLAQSIRQAYFGSSGSSAVQAMTPLAFMRGFLQAVDRDMLESGVSRPEPLEVVGVVPEGDDMHALVRSRMQAAPDAPPMLSMDVFSLRRDGGQWKLLLSGELEHTAHLMRINAGLDR